jgi:hypothetical protein
VNHLVFVDHFRLLPGILQELADGRFDILPICFRCAGDGNEITGDKTAFTKGKANSSMARGDGLADSTSGKSILLPGYNSLLATNFMVSGLGVISVYMLMTGLPVVIIFFALSVQN